MIFRSMVGKLWLIIITLLLVTFILLGFVLSQMMENFYLNLRANELTHYGKQLSLNIGQAQNQTEIISNLDFISDLLNANIMILDRRGIVQAQAGQLDIQLGASIHNPDLERVVKGDIIVRRGMHPWYDASMMSVAVPILSKNQGVGGVFIDAPLAPMTQTINSIRDIILYAAIATILMATILAFFLSKYLSKPLIKMKDVALSMAEGDLSKRVTVSSKDEIGSLGRTLNYLGIELQSNLNDLMAEKTQLANILSSMTEGVISFDSKGRVITLNPPGKRVLSLFSNEDLTPGKNLPQDDFYRKLKVLVMGVIEGESWLIDELENEGNSYLLKLAPIKGVGETLGAVAVISDISKEKKLDQMRKEFIANVSHELRTPLSFLQGYVEAILDGIAETEEERENYLQIILEETLRLRKLVNELLDITQMEAGQQQMNIEEADLGVLITGVARKLQPLASDLGIDFRQQVPMDLAPVLMDTNKIEQVLINLLDNAFRHTEKGKVVIKVEQEQEKINVTIVDNGTGINPNNLPYIFDRFYKIDKSRNRVSGGTGLGLAIVKNIINAHGQDISVNSKLNQGTSFTFSLQKGLIR